MTREVWAAALALLLAPAIASAAGEAEIDQRCTRMHPNVWQYFAWKECVKTATQQELEENLKRMREEQARPCIAADVSRMEGLAAKARGAVKPEWSLEEVQAALSPILGHQGEIKVSNDNIKERVLIQSISTKCDATFRFLINVRAGPDQKLRWLRTWAIDPPAGYPADYHREFSVDFDQQRQEESYRAEAAKRDELFRAAMAKQEQERDEQHQKMLQSIRISDVKMKCMGVGFCSMRILEFVVTNVSQQPIKDISFGWMLPPPQMTACPPKLATKEQRLLVLQPGEKAPISIYISNAPENADARYCLSVTDVGIPWPSAR